MFEVGDVANLSKTYKLGDPLESGVNLGPVVSVASAKRIRAQVEQAGERDFRNLRREPDTCSCRRG